MQIEFVLENYPISENRTILARFSFIFFKHNKNRKLGRNVTTSLNLAHNRDHFSTVPNFKFLCHRDMCDDAKNYCASFFLIWHQLCRHILVSNSIQLAFYVNYLVYNELTRNCTFT